MTPLSLLERLRQRDYTVSIEDDRLAVEPGDLLGPDDIAALKVAKPILIELLFTLEVAWRVRVMRQQLPLDRLYPIPSLVAITARSVPYKRGTCFSCGARLTDPETFGRCSHCGHAARVVLGVDVEPELPMEAFESGEGGRDTTGVTTAVAGGHDAQGKPFNAQTWRDEMAIVARKPETAFTPCPKGLHHAVCVDVVDLGMVQTPWGDKHQVRFVWQVATVNSDTSKRFEVRKLYNLSLHEKATLRKDLESWRGANLSDAELTGLDLEESIGLNAQLQVIHKDTEEDRTYANVQAIVPAPTGVAQLEPLDYVREVDRSGTEATSR